MVNPKLEKLRELMKIANDGLTREEFLASFKAAVDQILKIETRVLDRVNKAVDKLSNEQTGLKEKTALELEKLKVELLKEAEKMFEEQRQNLNFIHDKVRRIKEGVNGKDGRDGAT